MNVWMIFREMGCRSSRRQMGSALVWMRCCFPDFAAVKPGERALDLGTGTGIIPLLLSAKTEGEHFSALEIQDEIARMAERSVKLNHLENKIEIVHGDIKEASRIFGAASFDVVTTNPPYMK